MTAPNLSHGDMRPILSVERFSQRHAILTLDYATFRRTSGRIDNNGSSGKVVIVGYLRTIAGMENIKHALRWRELLKSERLAFHQIQQYASAQQMRCLRIANQGTQRRHYA